MDYYDMVSELEPNMTDERKIEVMMKEFVETDLDVWYDVFIEEE